MCDSWETPWLVKSMILSSLWTAPTQRLSIIWYFIMPKLFFVCVRVSQLFLVNPDQLACQEWVTDTVDLKSISRLAVSFPPTSSVCFLSHLLHYTNSFLLLPFPSLLPSIPRMTPVQLFDTGLTVILRLPNTSIRRSTQILYLITRNNTTLWK